VFPVLLFVWFLIIALAKSLPTHKQSLRGGEIISACQTFYPLTYNTQIDKKEPVKFDLVKIKEEVKTDASHLIIVAGHAVMRLSKLNVAAKSDDGWYLLPYQRKIGFPSIISAHIRKGVELAKRSTQAILIFSGGQTRRDVGPLSEAASYYFLANQMNWIDEKSAPNIYLEEYARDSFENLLFSICRFREITGYYPKSVSVVGFDFKGKRFSSFHRQSIGFPHGNFSYIGNTLDAKL
jgi:hypothetical protein